jgi:hypothetical protein
VDAGRGPFVPASFFAFFAACEAAASKHSEQMRHSHRGRPDLQQPYQTSRSETRDKQGVEARQQGAKCKMRAAIPLQPPSSFEKVLSGHVGTFNGGLDTVSGTCVRNMIRFESYALARLRL